MQNELVRGIENIQINIAIQVLQPQKQSIDKQVGMRKIIIFKSNNLLQWKAC